MDELGAELAADYAALRRRVFGFDLAPLPDGLALSRADEETNRRAKLSPQEGGRVVALPKRKGDRVQTGDGYAAYVAGTIVGAPIGVTTDGR